jgi:hypothetical protein
MEKMVQQTRRSVASSSTETAKQFSLLASARWIPPPSHAPPSTPPTFSPAHLLSWHPATPSTSRHECAPPSLEHALLLLWSTLLLPIRICEVNGASHNTVLSRMLLLCIRHRAIDATESGFVGWHSR